VSNSDEHNQDQFQSESDAPAQGMNLITATLRRWPLVLLGIGFGLVLGLLMYVQATRIFQSGAQVLIVKKNAAILGAANNQFAYLEDYVGTQVTLLKSEKVLRAAAVKVDKGQLHISFPDEGKENERITYLTNGLTVTRDKEGMAGSMGSNVLNLAFRCPNAADSAYILDTIIKSYKNELALVYEQTTREQIENLNAYVVDREKERSRLQQELQSKLAAMRGLSLEEFQAIQQRYADLGRQYASSIRDLKEAQFNLKIISEVGRNANDRAEAAAKLGIRLKMVDLTMTDLNNVTNALKKAEFNLDTLKKRYGDDHPLIIDAKAQLEFLQKLNKEMNPEGDSKEVFLDELARKEKFLRAQESFLREHVQMLESKMKDDLQLGIQIGGLQSDCQLIKSNLEKLEQDIKDQNEKKNKLDVAKLSGGYEATIITNPADGIQVAPSLTRTMALWLLLGVLAGVGLAVVVELTDKSFRTPAEIRRRLGLPVIGHIPPIRTSLANEKGATGNMDAIVVSHLRPKSTEAEAYRGVRTSLYFSTQGRGHQVIQVTSPNPGDGKSTLAANLAVSIAQSGKRAVLIDCDFRKPRIHKIFHVEKPEVGLASIITGESTVAASIRPTDVENLSILPCGPRPANPAELLTSPEFQAIVDKLRAEYDFVIIDTPPVLAVSDPLVVAPRVDGVLLVFRMTKKARPTAERAREQLAAVGSNVLGVVVNGTGQRRDDYYGYGYGYNYGYGYQYQYQYEYEYADDYSDDEPSSHELEIGTELPPAKG
jgi:capsular exopolysaccharide synthesis family protein